MQLSLLGDTGKTWRTLALPDADVRFMRDFLSRDAAERLFDELLRVTPWKQDTITFYGKTHNVPRLHQWYGDAGLTYRWSGITMRPEPWTAPLQELRQQVEDAVRAFFPSQQFNTVLLNHYRNGSDSVSWHADDEPELGSEPVIASVSLGAERDFMLRHLSLENWRESVALTHGSLLLMGGSTQRYWQHAILKRKSVTRPRVNLTFRFVTSGGSSRPCAR